MKKLIITLIGALTVLCALGVTAYAANGDIAGTLYTTDILTRVDGMDIPSYCIDGKTLIAVEDLRNFGYTVVYDDSVRTLFATYNNETYKPGMGTVERGTVGGTAGYYYETDIKVLVNGKYIPSYAIDGVMVVVVEDLGQADYFAAYSYDDGSRLLSLYTDYQGRLSGAEVEQHVIDEYYGYIDSARDAYNSAFSDKWDYQGDLVRYDMPNCTFFFGTVESRGFGHTDSSAFGYLVYKNGVYFDIDQIINGAYNAGEGGAFGADPYWSYPANPSNQFGDFAVNADKTAVCYSFDGAHYDLDVNTMINTRAAASEQRAAAVPVTQHRD